MEVMLQVSGCKKVIKFGIKKSSTILKIGEWWVETYYDDDTMRFILVFCCFYLFLTALVFSHFECVR